MAISGQQNINIGTQNESDNSDSLFIAFNKVQNNFNTLFNAASNYTNFDAGQGIGISTNGATGTVTVNNTGVKRILPGSGIAVSSQTGNVTISVTADAVQNLVAGVTSIDISSDTLAVDGGPIVSEGSISVNLPSVITPGSYNNPSVTIDQYGRVIDIESNDVAGTVTSVSLVADEGIAISGGPITSSGEIIVKNTGVTKLMSGGGIELSGSNGAVTIAATVGGGTVTSVNITSDVLTITGGLDVQGNVVDYAPITRAGTIDLAFKPDISVTGNISSGNLSVAGLASFGTMFVDQLGTVDGNTNIIGNLSVTGNVDITNKLTVLDLEITPGGMWTLGEGTDFVTFGNVTAHGNVDVGKNLRVVNNFTVDESGNIGADLVVGGNITGLLNSSIVGDLLVGGNITVVGTTTLGQSATIGYLEVTNDGNIQGNLNIAGDVQIGTGLSITTSGTTSIITDGSIISTVLSTGTAFIDGEGIITGNAYVLGAGSYGGNLQVSGDMAVLGNLYVAGSTEYTVGNMYAKEIFGNIHVVQNLILQDINQIVSPSKGTLGVDYANNKLCIWYDNYLGTFAWRSASLSPPI